MKFHHFIAPILATLGIGFWLNGQENSLNLIMERTRVLEERINLVARRDSSSIPSSEMAKQEPSLLLSDGTLDWQSLADALADSNDPSKTLARQKISQRMRQILEGMSADELESAYLKLDQLNLDSTQVDSFRRFLRIHLAVLDPEKALLFLGDSPFPHDDFRSDERRDYFTIFAQKDPEAAALWLDRQIAIGSLATTVLDPLRNPRLDLEGALLGRLFRNNPAAARDRIAIFNAEERERVFSDPYQRMRDGKLPDDYLSYRSQSIRAAPSDRDDRLKIAVSTRILNAVCETDPKAAFMSALKFKDTMDSDSLEINLLVQNLFATYGHSDAFAAIHWLLDNKESAGIIADDFKRNLLAAAAQKDPVAALGFVKIFDTPSEELDFRAIGRQVTQENVYQFIEALRDKNEKYGQSKTSLRAIAGSPVMKDFETATAFLKSPELTPGERNVVTASLDYENLKEHTPHPGMARLA